MPGFEAALRDLSFGSPPLVVFREPDPFDLYPEGEVTLRDLSVSLPPIVFVSSRLDFSKWDLTEPLGRPGCLCTANRQENHMVHRTT